MPLNLKKYQTWIVLAAGALFFVVMGLKIFYGPLFDWNGRRLAGMTLLAFHTQMYFLMGKGVALSGLGGPTSAFAFLPAILGQSTNSAIRFGVLLSSLYFYLPILFLFLSDPRGIKLERILWFLCFGLFALKSEALLPSAFMIHSDAPAIGFSLAAVFVILRRKSDRFSTYLLAATFAVLGLHSKITFIPVSFGILVYLALAYGKQSAVRFLYALCISFVVVTSLYAACFGARELFFNNVIEHLHFNWTAGVTEGAGVANGPGTRVKAVFAAFIEYLESYYFLFVLVFFLGWKSWSGRKESLRTWFQKNEWTLFAILSLVLLLPSLMARVKVGGAINNQTPTLLFLTLSALWLLMSYFEERKAFAFQTTVLVVLALLQVKYIYSCKVFYPELVQNPDRVAFEFAKAHPEEIYFPEYPLATLLADRKIYHSGASFAELEGIGQAYSEEDFRKYLPSKMKWLAYRYTELPRLLRKFPEFSKRVTLPELPDWIVFTK